MTSQVSKVLDFKLKQFRSVRICFRNKHVLNHFTPWKRYILQFSCSFEKYNFDIKILQHVRFRIEDFTTPQILQENSCNVSEFGLETFWLGRFWKNVCVQKSCFESFYNCRKDFFVFFSWFSRQLDSKSEFVLRVQFESTNFTTQQVLTEVFQNKSEFELKIFLRVR